MTSRPWTKTEPSQAESQRPVARESEPSPINASPRGTLERLAENLRRRGVLGTGRRVLRRLQSAVMERWLGIHTRGSIHANQLGSTGVRYGYQPIDYQSFYAAMRAIEWRESDVFADYGCGLGRAVILAARYPLRRVIGVELSESLCAAARENVRRARRRLRCPSVEIVCADATTYVTPDDLSLLFMYNPFGADVLDAAMEQVRRSLERRPRRLQVIYAIPNTDADGLASADWLTQTREVSTENIAWERVSIYENCRHRAGEVS
ncbi:MAG: class I SAM-dependent methyltransferase [Planctomycetales bacterium]|nr:class I SAM-dependent methyltransferase [Planctomycetales bacterium]